MPIRKKSGERNPRRAGADFFDHLWEKSWTYIKTVVDVVREPVLILDHDLRVMAANDAFYETFQVTLKDTKDKIVYQLGDGQWDIPSLRKLLDDILAHNTFFKGFQVAHEFPGIGRKVMILNARQIYIKEHNGPSSFPPIILLAMEDVTEMMVVAETLASHNDQLAAKFAIRAQKMELQIEKLEREIAKLKKKS
jgi:nitrogen-specific signal transduction histidine kinase